jgi:hypothetical protein
MAQAQLDSINFKFRIDSTTQTTKNDNRIYLSESKIAKLYHSHKFKQNVVCFGFTNSKKQFLLTKKDWVELKKHYYQLNEHLNG